MDKDVYATMRPFQSSLTDPESALTNEACNMTKKSNAVQTTQSQIYRAVASSTAIETGVPVQKIEQQLKKNLALAKAVGLAR